MENTTDGIIFKIIQFYNKMNFYERYQRRSNASEIRKQKYMFFEINY